MATAPPTTQPLILLISLHHEAWFDEMYSRLLSQLQAKATVRRVKQARSVAREFTTPRPPTAVLVTDAALSEPKHRAQWDAVVAYARGGGTVVVMGIFSSFVKPDRVQPFFAVAGLPWASASYQRTTFALVPAAVGPARAARLAPAYSQKALHVKNVAATDAWYRVTDDSVVESHVFPPTPVADTGETPVAFAKVGDGWMGYLGDVNAEKHSDEVIMAMCGLLD